MQKQELSELFELDCANFGFSQDLLNSCDCVILNALNDNISQEVIDVYRKFQPMKPDAPDSMKMKLFSTIRSFAQEQSTKKHFLDALVLYRFLIVKSEIPAQDYFSVAEIFENILQYKLADEFLTIYSRKEQNKPLLCLTLGNFYNLTRKDYKTAIKYYEKYLEIDETKSVIYTIVSNLYSKTFGDESLEQQINYLEKAYKLKPHDRTILHGLAFNHEKFGNKECAKYFYQELLKNNPTDNDYYNYGAFLISSGDFLEGHNYFRARSTDIDLPNKWDLESDISEKTLLIHYEEGFGDTIMYCRFVPFMKNFAKKIIFVVQEELLDLIKNSSEVSKGIEVRADVPEYDYYMRLLDTPYVLKTTVDTLPFLDKYLNVNAKYIESAGQNLKVGIAYHGDNCANYHGRDLDLAKFNILTGIDGVDFYSLQYGEDSQNPKIIPLGKTFKNFIDTASAVKSMDLVITTDNVILNLAGALGVKTIGLFNKQTNYRWFKLDGNDVGWYNSVKPLQVDVQDDWNPVFQRIISELKQA